VRSIVRVLFVVNKFIKIKGKIKLDYPIIY